MTYDFGKNDRLKILNKSNRPSELKPNLLFRILSFRFLFIPSIVLGWALSYLFYRLLVYFNLLHPLISY